MATGSVPVGSRRPVNGFPAWATPEVAYGGFASGRMLAGGNLAPHEQQMATKLRACRSFDATVCGQREAVHEFLTCTEEGLQSLLYRLKSKRYRIDVPEEACLMVYAWLCEHGCIDEATKLLATVRPFFDRLRFHPPPTIQPVDFSRVSHKPIEDFLEDARWYVHVGAETTGQREARKARFLFWDAFVNLWISTLDRPSSPPSGSYVRDATNKTRFQLARDTAWPGQAYPANWDEMATDVLKLYDRFEGKMKHSPVYTEAAKFIRLALQDRRTLTGREVGKIRMWLAAAKVKRGLPGDARYEEWKANAIRSLDASSMSVEVFEELTRLVREQTAAPTSGDDVSLPFLSPTQGDGIRAALAIKFPSSKVQKTLSYKLFHVTGMTCEELYASERVRSLAVVAEKLPFFASVVLASQVKDDSARYLLQQLRQSFMRRRSLLLFDYASQVGVSEVPWAAALGRSIASLGLESTDKSGMETFAHRIVGLSMKRFGETPIRNFFLRTLRELFIATGTQCDLLRELAADIFMGGFVPKFARVHRAVALFLSGTCYDRYYAISETVISPSKGDATPEGNRFALSCRARAERYQPGCARMPVVSSNGRLIEQAQILTSHNMATLFETCKLAQDLGAWDVPGIIRRGTGAILKHLRCVHALQTPGSGASGRIGPHLRHVGYLWRQLVFWFAVLEKYETSERFISMVDELEATSLSDERNGCRLDKFREFFSDLIAVLRSERTVDRVVLADARLLG